MKSIIEERDKKLNELQSDLKGSQKTIISLENYILEMNNIQATRSLLSCSCGNKSSTYSNISDDNTISEGFHEVQRLDKNPVSPTITKLDLSETDNAEICTNISKAYTMVNDSISHNDNMSGKSDRLRDNNVHEKQKHLADSEMKRKQKESLNKKYFQSKIPRLREPLSPPLSFSSASTDETKIDINSMCQNRFNSIMKNELQEDFVCDEIPLKRYEIFGVHIAEYNNNMQMEIEVRIKNLRAAHLQFAQQMKDYIDEH